MARFKKREISKRLECAKKMPPLYHKLPDDAYDVMKSQTVDWLVQQPDIREWLWTNVSKKDALMSYDARTGKWTGADYDV